MRFKFFFILITVHAVLITILFFKSGIRIDGEAQKYISAAKLISEQSDFSGLSRHYFYSSYILLLAFLFKIGLAFNGIIIFQLLLNLLCAYFVFVLLIRLTLRKQIGYYGSLFFLLCLPIQQWVLALYTESFFICLLVIFSFLLTGKQTATKVIVLTITGLLLAFCRPIGIFIAIGGFFVGTQLVSKKMQPAYIVSIIFLLASIFLVGFLIPIDCLQVAIPILQGSIIYGFPQWNENISISPPCNLYTVYQILLNQEGYLSIMELIFRRIQSLYTFTRQYYSTIHNLILSSYYVLYFMALIGFFFSKKITTEFRIFCVTSVFFLTLVTGFTHDEWSARFQVPILVFVIFYAAVGLDLIFIRLNNLKGMPAK